MMEDDGSGIISNASSGLINYPERFLRTKEEKLQDQLKQLVYELKDQTNHLYANHGESNLFTIYVHVYPGCSTSKYIQSINSMSIPELEKEIEVIENAIAKQLKSANINIEVEDDDPDDLIREEEVVTMVERKFFRDGLIAALRSNDKMICFKDGILKINNKREFYDKSANYWGGNSDTLSTSLPRQFGSHGFKETSSYGDSVWYEYTKGDATTVDELDNMLKGVMVKHKICAHDGCTKYAINSSNIKTCLKHTSREEGSAYRERVNEWQRRQRQDNEVHRLKSNMRSRLRSFLVRRNIQKKGSTFDIIQKTPLELKEYLENHQNFKRGEFDWNENRHRWHIDHIMPLDAIKDMIKDMGIPQDDAVKMLSHWSNLQPLKLEHNLSKSNKRPKNWAWDKKKGEWGYSDGGPDLKY